MAKTLGRCQNGDSFPFWKRLGGAGRCFGFWHLAVPQDLCFSFVRAVQVLMIFCSCIAASFLRLLILNSLSGRPTTDLVDRASLPSRCTSVLQNKRPFLYIAASRYSVPGSSPVDNDSCNDGGTTFMAFWLNSPVKAVHLRSPSTVVSETCRCISPQPPSTGTCAASEVASRIARNGMACRWLRVAATHTVAPIRGLPNPAQRYCHPDFQEGGSKTAQRPALLDPGRRRHQTLPLLAFVPFLRWHHAAFGTLGSELTCPKFHTFAAMLSTSLILRASLCMPRRTDVPVILLGLHCSASGMMAWCSDDSHSQGRRDAKLCMIWGSEGVIGFRYKRVVNPRFVPDDPQCRSASQASQAPPQYPTLSVYYLFVSS